MKMKNEQVVPVGFMQDAKGRLVPESMIKPIDLARDQLVKELAQKAKSLRETMKAFAALSFGDVKAFVDMSCEQYGVTIGGKKGNITLQSFDGKLQVKIQVAERITFDEKLQAAKVLVDKCINEWSEGSNDKIKVLVHGAFQTDKEGKINTGRVLELRRLNIDDDGWKTAMQAIGDAVQVSSTKEYIRFYERVGDTNKYQPISLDIASL